MSDSWVDTLNETVSSGGNVLYLRDNWLDTTSSAYHVWTTPTFTYHYYPSHRIEMTLDELEHIRELCRSDKKLRKFMKRLAPRVDITVDFPGK